MKIAVLGAGVNGLTCAVRIKEKYKDCEVSVISEEFSPHTTGDGSGGLWLPYLCGDTPEHLITQWGSSTYRFIDELWREGFTGVTMLPIFEVAKKKEDLCNPNWLRHVYGYQELGSKQLGYFNNLYSDQFVVGQTFTTFILYPPAILSYLRDRFERANGQIINSSITSLNDPILEDYDVIVNCTGLGAKHMVPDDKMLPIRGQVARHATVLSHWAGLRPARESVRLEAEYKNGKLYIHNYGHGGSGFTLFWGCGTQVLELLDKNINEKCKIKSKL